MIKPTVGRIVWYTPSEFDRAAMTVHDDKQPLAGIVTYVWNDRMVNLLVTDHSGAPYAKTSVPLLQDDDPRPETGFFAEWMPYQKGQAAKTEAAEARAAA